jgi:signal transduction histidine kinase
LIAISARPEVIHGPGWWTVGKLLTVIAILIVALIVASLRSYLAKRIAKLKLNERTQLAVEIHDSLSQALTGLACQITAAQDSLETNTKNTENKLATASQMLMSCRTELRNCLFDLRNDTIGEKNFNKAIIKTIEPFESSAAIIVRFQVNRALFEDTTVHAILAVIRELVSNAVRHGNAWTIRIAGVIEGKTLLFSVTDDGSGFDFEHRKNSDEGHFGIDGIRERLARLEGSISYETPPSGGTKAVVKIPLRHS